MGDLTPVLVLGVIFYFIVELVRTVADSKLRTQLLDKGLVDEKAKTLFTTRSRGDAGASLKWGMVSIGVGAAFLIGMTPWVPAGFREEVTAGSMFLLAGLGLIIYYFIARGGDRDQQD
jgi:hypothetical protein